MDQLLSVLGRAGDLALVLLGFSLIIVIHELGHFLAARWAKIRVLAFAVGFGPALVSYRRGLGWRRGSSEAEYKKLVGASPAEAHAPSAAAAVSTTEYRLNVLPFGGYVKMLGQDDADPSARSSEPDSYQSVKPWKRMIVISAGVVANVITAAILFVVVFMVGLKTEPPKIGLVSPGAPAATTTALNAASLGVTEPGLKPGDVVLAINGEKPQTFHDVMLESMMTRRGASLQMDIERPGLDGVLRFSIVPEVNPASRLLMIGATPSLSTRVVDAPATAEREAFRKVMHKNGLVGVEPGMSLVSVNGRPAQSPFDLLQAVGPDGGAVRATFTDDDGRTVDVTIPAHPRLMEDLVNIDGTQQWAAEHLLGLLPVLAVEDVVKDSSAARAGLMPGDIFVQIGSLEWPSVPAGVGEIRAHRAGGAGGGGGTIRIVVARPDGAGGWKEVDLGDVKVSRSGTIGFAPGASSAKGPWIGAALGAAPGDWDPPRIRPGSRIVAVDDRPTATLLDVRRELGAAANRAPARAVLTVESALEAADGSRPVDEVVWELDERAVAALRDQPYELAISPMLVASMFEPEQFLLKAADPAGAIAMGLRETKRVMITTYLTFARLFQGTVKVEHLKGPVGIAHVGTILADRGFIWVLFFMALISVNLAVINFLPIPIADGGHFVYLLYEQFTGKPVSVGVQNAAAVVGLILLAAVFLIVTFNDITNLFGG